jgi:hypothetical protein
MADAHPGANASGKPKRVIKKRPIFAIYRISDAGDLDDLILTKDSLEVLNKCEGSDHKYKRFDNLVLGR